MWLLRYGHERVDAGEPAQIVKWSKLTIAGQFHTGNHYQHILLTIEKVFHVIGVMSTVDSGIGQSWLMPWMPPFLAATLLRKRPNFILLPPAYFFYLVLAMCEEILQ